MVTELIPAQLEQDANFLRTMLRRSAQNIVDIGLKLAEVRTRFKRTKDFYNWVEQEVRISHGSADNFMHAAALVQKFPNLGAFDHSVIYELAAPKTPPEVVAAVQNGQIEASIPAIREAKRAARGDHLAPVKTSEEKLVEACFAFVDDWETHEERVEAFRDACNQVDDDDQVVSMLEKLIPALRKVRDDLKR